MRNENKMLVTMNWKNALSSEQVNSLHEGAIEDILTFFYDFLERQHTPIYEVLNALPGHGKTISLKLFVKDLIQTSHTPGILIVLREIEHMRDFATFFSSAESSSVLYIDGENFQSLKNKIKEYQVVIISHERFKVFNIEGENLELFTSWENRNRMVVIDEMPPFVDSVSFDLSENKKWINDCFQTNPTFFNYEKRVLIRSLLQILIAQELIENNQSKTKSLQSHVDSEYFRKTLEEFFQLVDPRKIPSFESRSMFRWFNKLYLMDDVGYIDAEFALNGYTDQKKIICSERIDYRKLQCSILILDGTAWITPTIYNEEYAITKIQSRTQFKRLTIHQHAIGTSLMKRKNRNKNVQKIIAQDMEILRSQGYTPFLLTNKFEVEIYKKMGVIPTDDLRFYEVENEGAALNILNTTGKNHLLDRNDLYLAALPNRPALFYKALAISLYNEEKALDLSTRESSVNYEEEPRWFKEKFIDDIYKEVLISEIFQIINRSNLRDLKADSKINIFIATTFRHLLLRLERVINELDEQISLSYTDRENQLVLSHQASDHAKRLIKAIKEKKISLPQSVGKIEDGVATKKFINRHWNNEDSSAIIRSAFQKCGLTILEDPNGYKKIHDVLMNQL